MNKPDLPQLIMDSLVEIIDKIATQNRIKKGDFAETVWPDSAPRVARNRWQNMRLEMSGRGRKQDVSVADAYRLAAALDQDLAYLLLKAGMMAEEKMEKLQAKAKPPKPKSRAGAAPKK